MNRRTLLATCGALLGTGLGGCLSQSETPGGPDDGPTDTQTAADPTRTRTGTDPTDTGTNTPTETGIVLDDVVVRKAVEYESMMGSGGVLAGADRQYVVATVRIPTDVSDPRFSFETDERSWDPGLPDTHGAVNRSVAGHEGGPFDRGIGDDRFLAFTVPAPLSASNPRIRLLGSPDVEWPLPDAAVDRLAAPAPRFDLDSLSVPDVVSQGDPLEVSLTVRNVSDVSGRFLAAVYWPTERIADDDESHVIERTVKPGQRVTESLSIDTEYTAIDSGSVGLHLEGHVDAERSVAVRNVTTTN